MRRFFFSVVSFLVVFSSFASRERALLFKRENVCE